MKKKTIKEKYESNSMSAFERKIYEYQEEVIERLNEVHVEAILAQGQVITDLKNKNNKLVRRCAELLGKLKDEDR